MLAFSDSQLKQVQAAAALLPVNAAHLRQVSGGLLRKGITGS